MSILLEYKPKTLNYFIERGVPFCIFKGIFNTFIVALDSHRSVPGDKPITDVLYSFDWFNKKQSYSRISIDTYLNG